MLGSHQGDSLGFRAARWGLLNPEVCRADEVQAGQVRVHEELRGVVGD